MFKCHCILVLLTVLYVVQSEDAAIKDEEERQDGGGAVGRAMRDFGGEEWKALPEHQLDNSGWIASENRQNQQGVPGVQKRRRLRKRKRRPQPLAESQIETQPRPRRRRPVRLDEVKDTWTEMEAESPKRPNNRRRVSPIYPVANQGVEASITVEDASLEKVKDPYIAMQEAVEKVRRRKIRLSTTTTSPPTSVQDIKILIKQSGGMSLSEILQQKNLSLSDLLKGKQQAISALAEKPKEILAVTESFEQRMSTIVENNDGVTDKAILDAQRRRFGSMYSNSQNRIYSDVTKYDVVTEPATDKRIFVPSHPKFYTSLNYRPELGSFMDQAKVTTTEMSETISQSSTVKSSSTQATTKGVSIQENVISKTPVRIKLPVTSAKLHRTVKKPSAIDTEKLPPKAMKINVSELFGYTQVIPENKTKESIGPLKMLFDLEELVKENVESLNTIIPIETTTMTTKIFRTTNKPETTRIHKTTSKVVKKPTQEKLKVVSAKDEIMEILQDEIAKENLSKILKLRNMTVDELVELRERGSSQRHLADIFHNKTREPEPKVEHTGEIKMDRKPKSNLKIPYKIINNEYDIQSLADININSEEIITSEKIAGTSFPTYKIESNKQSKETPPLHIPIWKTIYPSVFNEPVIQKEIFNTKLQRIGEIENTIVEAVNEGLSNRNNYDYDDFIQLPVGVKSAIFASLAIIGISLILFLTILMIFKWTQRHKKRLCYGGSFSGSKIKSPILESDSRRSLKSFMSETLGRKKSFYASSRLQSMSDSWDNDKPYQ